MGHDHLRNTSQGGAAMNPLASLMRALVTGLTSVVMASAAAQDIEREPIRYSASNPQNAISQFEERLSRGTAKLEYESAYGYLRSLLKGLDVPESSQVLVFSKTSFQRERISPSTPRAIYFNDDVMVGYCNGGRVMEISAADEAIGTAFYTIDQSREREAGHSTSDRVVFTLPQFVGESGVSGPLGPLAVR